MNEPFDAKEACDHCLRPIARYSDLVAGQQFRFPGQSTVLLRTKSGYRRIDGTFGTFSTGGRTAVIPITTGETR